MFNGNADDCFRLGIQIQRKFLKLYTDFYSSDIIVASPLGLRTVLGATGYVDMTPYLNVHSGTSHLVLTSVTFYFSDKKCDHDFLSSIELLIMDQCDVFLMQNWQHVEVFFFLVLLHYFCHISFL